MNEFLSDTVKTNNPTERDAILYIDHKPEPNVCPYCGQPFVDIVGCHKICRCGYMEGCGD